MIQDIAPHRLRNEFIPGKVPEPEDLLFLFKGPELVCSVREDVVSVPRIRDVQIQGSTLIAAIDGIPVTIALPPKVVDAYEQGALPIGTLANAVLAKCDQMQDMTQARYRFDEESREVGRGLSQR